VHALNFYAGGDPGIDLHLCVHERLLTAVPGDHGHAFGSWLDEFQLPRERVVIMLPKMLPGSEARQAVVAANYRGNGFRVACTALNAEQLLLLRARVRADVLRIDAGWLASAAGALAADVPVMQPAADLMVCRIEQPQQRAAALSLGASLLQGHAVAAPQAAPPTAGPA